MKSVQPMFKKISEMVGKSSTMPEMKKKNPRLLKAKSNKG